MWREPDMFPRRISRKRSVAEHAIGVLLLLAVVAVAVLAALGIESLL